MCLIAVHAKTEMAAGVHELAESLLLSSAFSRIAHLHSLRNVLVAESAPVVFHLLFIFLAGVSIVVGSFIALATIVLLAVRTEDPVLAEVLAVSLVKRLTVWLAMVVVDVLLLLNLEHVSTAALEEPHIFELPQNVQSVNLEVLFLSKVVLYLALHESSTAALNWAANVGVFEDVVEVVAFRADFMLTSFECVHEGEEVVPVVVLSTHSTGVCSVLNLWFEPFLFSLFNRLLHLHHLERLRGELFRPSRGFNFFVRLLLQRLLSRLLLLCLMYLQLEKLGSELHVCVSMRLSFPGNRLDGLEKKEIVFTVLFHFAAFKVGLQILQEVALLLKSNSITADTLKSWLFRDLLNLFFLRFSAQLSSKSGHVNMIEVHILVKL